MRVSTRTFLLLTPGLLLAQACSEEAGIGKIAASMTLPTEYDFGAVQVGLLGRKDLTIENSGQGTFQITRLALDSDASTTAYEFKLRGEAGTLAPRAKLTFSVTFQPLQASPTPYETKVFVETDGKDADGNQVKGTIRLIGLGIESGLKVEPNPADFGTLLAGTTADVELKITNLLTTPTELRTALDATGRPSVQVLDGDGEFEIIATPTRDGSLLGQGQLLQPNQTITVQARYRAPLRALNRTDRARWVVSNCNDTICEVRVELLGRATANAIECTPAPLAFGSVNPNRMATRKVTCKNVATAPVEIIDWFLAPGSSAEFTAAPFAGGPGILMTNQSFDIDVTFAPTLASLTSIPPPAARLVVSSKNPTGLALDPVEVPITGRAGGPTISVTPNPLTFGTYAIGTSVTRRMLVSNEGWDALVVTAIDTNPGMTGSFSAYPQAFTLATGTSTVVDVTFAPMTEGFLMDQAIFASNDPAGPYSVGLVGTGRNLLPCQYTITPSILNFGLAYAGTSETLPLRLDNVGPEECLVNDVDLAGTSSAAFALDRGPETGLVIPVGGSLEFPITFTPPRPGPYDAELRFSISDPGTPNVSVPLAGTGEAATQITCPPSVTTPARVPITLTVNPQFLGTMRQSVVWSVISSPMGGAGTPNLWTPDPPTSDTEIFQPYLVGVYVIEVTATDTNGGTASCQTTVTAEGQGLRVTMTWNGTGDVDLHLHNQNVAMPWFSAPDDCYYANRQPIWDTTYIAGVGTNPTLDFDNTSGFGPENMSLDTVILGVPYTVGVHNYSSAAGRNVDITIFCGQSTTPVASYTSRALAGGTGGNCSANDFWKVATVVFSSQSSCTVTTIDTYGPSSAACLAY